MELGTQIKKQDKEKLKDKSQRELLGTGDNMATERPQWWLELEFTCMEEAIRHDTIQRYVCYSLNIILI
jgi:hypothetical protein